MCALTPHVAQPLNEILSESQQHKTTNLTQTSQTHVQVPLMTIASEKGPLQDNFPFGLASSHLRCQFLERVNHRNISRAPFPPP